MNVDLAARGDVDGTYRRFPDGLPDELLDLPERELLAALGKPTLIRVPGDGDAPPRAVACLLHGDESTGFKALHRILRRRRTYPFDFYAVVGNVRAALEPPGYAHRFLDDQEDFNRIWGLDDPTTQARRAADAMLAALHDAGIESMVDIHNNTGNNPFYAIVTTLRPETLNLATLWTTTILHWDLGANTLMEALEDDCAAIAVECGLPGLPESLAFAVDGLRRYLGARPLETDRVRRDFDMLGGLRKVIVKPEVRFQFGGELTNEVDFVIDEDADVHNFIRVDAGHVIGRVHPGSAMPVRAIEPGGNDVTDEHFSIRDGEVVLECDVTPVMMTRTVEATRKDCLFYLTNEFPPPAL
ncbi:MAG: succinylglutamate desuccinylase/aspartoacylase family protein [Nitriliruptorales bacterium]|nr:succinylglutamate desuccinylase/aspartoacylase family protein [Nitriliruptorales bacterium]